MYSEDAGPLRRGSEAEHTHRVEIALHYVKRGWSVVPLHTVAECCSCAAGAACSSPGAHPRGGLTVADATTDPARIEAWWSATPDANIGLAAGRVSGIFALRYDIDKLPAQARAVLDAVLATRPWIVGEESSTAQLAIMAAEPHAAVPSKTFGEGLALRGDGDILVVPWSHTASGRVNAEEEPPLVLPPSPWALHELVALCESAVRTPERVAAASDAVTLRTPEPHRQLVVRKASEIAAVPIDWLWRGFIARRSITIIDGDPGTAKSTIALDIAARLTRGDTCPLSDERIAPASALVIAAEDDEGSVLRPRLDAAGALVEHVVIATKTSDFGRTQQISLADDIDLIEAVCVEHGVRLLVIDPVNDYMGRGVDVASDHAVREVLNPLRDLARRLDLAIILVRHLVKSKRGPAMHHGTGSIAFAGLARTVLRATIDATVGRLEVVKANLSAPGLALGYRVVQETRENGIEATRVEWIAAPGPTESERPLSARERARAFLREFLAAGTVSANDVKAAAAKDGIKERTLDSAKGDLGVMSHRVGSVWMWALPEGRNARDSRGARDVADFEGDNDDAEGDA